MSLTTPWFCNSTIQAVVRTRSEVQNGTSTSTSNVVDQRERRMDDGVRDGIADHEAQGGDAEAHPERPEIKRYVDASCLWHRADASVRPRFEVNGVQEVARRERLSRLPDRPPGGVFGPGVVDVDKGFPPGTWRIGVDIASKAARRFDHDAAQAALNPVDARRGAPHRAFVPGAQQFPGNGSRRLPRKASRCRPNP